MSEAEPAEPDADAETPEKTGPSFSEQVEDLIGAVGEDELLEIEEPDALETEAIKRVEIRNEYEPGVEELDDTKATGNELDRLYNEEALSLADIGRLYYTTDATIQRRMEQHGLERRGNRAELSKGELIDELQALAVDINDVSDFDEFQELAEKGEATQPTTTAMTEEGSHSAHTYYNHFDSWADAVEAAGAMVVDVPDKDEADDE